MLAVVCAEPVKLTLALGETVEARETEGCPLVLRAAEEEASELFEGGGRPAHREGAGAGARKVGNQRGGHCG